MTSVSPTRTEVVAALPGDERLEADVVMDRGFDLPATPVEVWPWLEQLGKERAGWYFPRAVERSFPRSRRGLRHLDPTLWLEVGQSIPDWGGRDETLTVLEIDPPHTLLHGSRRGGVEMTWALDLTRTPAGTRVHSRVRLAGVRRVWLAEHGGGLVDRVTIAGLAGGLRERVSPT